MITMARLPGNLMSQCVEIRQGEPEYRADKGGQYLPGEKTRIAFKGAILPLSERDLRQLPQGTYTADTRKLYTNGYAVMVGSKVEANGITYLVTSEMEYGDIHGLHLYTIEAKRV